MTDSIKNCQIKYLSLQFINNPIFLDKRKVWAQPWHERKIQRGLRRRLRWGSLLAASVERGGPQLPDARLPARLPAAQPSRLQHVPQLRGRPGAAGLQCPPVLEHEVGGPGHAPHARGIRVQRPAQDLHAGQRWKQRKHRQNTTLSTVREQSTNQILPWKFFRQPLC